MECERIGPNLDSWIVELAWANDQNSFASREEKGIALKYPNSWHSITVLDTWPLFERFSKIKNRRLLSIYAITIMKNTLIWH